MDHISIASQSQDPVHVQSKIDDLYETDERKTGWRCYQPILIWPMRISCVFTEKDGDIEVFFKMAKQHLKLAKEIQCRDYDALIAHTTIVFMRYMFLAYQCRMETDHRTFGDLFYACCDEVADISFMEALYRILALATDRLKQLGTFCEKTAVVFFDAIINTALQCVGLSKNNLVIA